MRGNYFNYANDLARVAAGLPPAADNRPQVVDTPNTAPTQADASAIVARVAHVLLQAEIDWDAQGLDTLTENHPSLKGLTRAQIDAAITEALA